MARLHMASFSYPEGLSEVSPLQRAHHGPRVLSKLEVLKMEYQERTLRAKEQKLLTLHPRVSGSIGRPLEEKTWVSNWTVPKRTAGVDRAHPLQPVHPRWDAALHPSSATPSAIKHSMPYVRSKSGPSRTEQWQELENRQRNLEAEIRRKEALLREKLRRTEEELRRIQREKQEAEQEEQRAPQVCEAKRRPRRSRLEEGGSGGMKDRPLSIDQYNKSRKDRPLSIDQYSESRKDRPLSIDQYSVSRKDRPLSIAQYSESRKDRPLSIDQYSENRKDRPLSIAQYSESRKDRPLSIDQYSESRKDRPVSISEAHPAVQGTVVDPPGVQDGGCPSFQLPEEAFPENPEQQLVQCPWCGRRFMEHRLQKHTAVCERAHGSRRKVFDSSKARAKGTDLEQYLLKKGRQPSPAPQVKASSWRKKHESFLRTVRQARVVQDVVARGGRIADLPPVPPEDNPDYVACPHCNRRFSPRAAERHIPKCETIKSRPRPPPSHRR